MYGNQYIYQSMPRLLTLWLDYGAHVSDLEKGNKVNKAAQVMAKLHKVSIIMSSPKGFFSYDGVNRCRFFFLRCKWMANALNKGPARIYWTLLYEIQKCDVNYTLLHHFKKRRWYTDCQLRSCSIFIQTFTCISIHSLMLLAEIIIDKRPGINVSVSLFVFCADHRWVHR